MISVEGLTKRYGSKTALKNVSFEIDTGEIVGLLGPNGAGKTTCMNIITGYMSSSKGKITVGGFDIMSSPREAKTKIGYLPETPPLYFDMTVKEYLNFVYDLKKCKYDRKDHLEEICEVVKITHVYNRLIGNLSKGYKQRVGMAQALVGNPEVLIMDEPTVGLDPKEIIEIRNLIKRLGVSRTVILSSHVLSEVQAICERIIILNEGVVVADALASELTMAMGVNTRYGVRLTGPWEEVETAFMTVPGVVSVDYSGVFEPETIDVLVECDAHSDIRRGLFEICAKHNWYILMIRPMGMSLEDIFIQLVNKSDENRALAGQSSEVKEQENEKEIDEDSVDTEDDENDNEAEENFDDNDENNEDGGDK